MADGKWVMTEDDAKRVDLTFSGSGRQNLRALPNYGKSIKVDDRTGGASAATVTSHVKGSGNSRYSKCDESGDDDRKSSPDGGRGSVHSETGDCRNDGRKCAFCGSGNLLPGFGGIGDGFAYRSFKCRNCGGTTDFVYKDDIGKFFR